MFIDVSINYFDVDIDKGKPLEILREEFIEAATGHSKESSEVFAAINVDHYKTSNRLLMALMMANPELVQQRQIEYRDWFIDRALEVAKKKYK